MNKVLVINCGSSSIKYRILDMDTETLIVNGLVERIGMEKSMVIHERADQLKKRFQLKLQDHNEAIEYVLHLLVDEEYGVLQSLDEISAVGHRIVHGGEHYSEAVYVTEEVVQEIEACSDMAPLHNHAHVLGIRACQKLMPETPMVCVFDTAFHQTMPPESYLYGIPYELYEKYKVRKYGFHGTSYDYITKRVAKMYDGNLVGQRMIVCHLGNGASITAIKDGKCYDTSMGLTPLEGLMMGTRSGSLDPAVITFLEKKEGFSADEIITILNKKSGMLGLSGISSDLRDVEAASEKGDERAEQAVDVYVHRIKSYIGAYVAEMNGLDMLVFTAGVGENSRWVRSRVCENMDYLGISIDENINQYVQGIEADISAPDSKVKVLVLPTREELMIARSTLYVLSNMDFD